MKSKVRLYAIYYRQGKAHHPITRMLANDAETAMRQARTIFKEFLSQLSGIEICSQELPLNRVVINAKDPA